MPRSRVIALSLALALAGCHGGLQTRNYPTPLALYAAGLAEFEKGKWGNAIIAFDQVTILLPPRDTLLAKSHLYLGRAHANNKSYLLAAATFKRLFEDFPDDTLADDALLAMADAEAKSWRGPERDPQHAVIALDAYSLLQRLYPASPLVAVAKAGEARMTDGLARSDLMTGIYYIKHGLHNSAIIYLRDASQMYPGTPAAREAMIKMVEVYRHLKYVADAADMCRTLRASAATDAAVVKACAGIPADTAK